MIHMEYYLIVSAIMFFAGIYGFFTRRNTLAILISIELILNATENLLGKKPVSGNMGLNHRAYNFYSCNFKN